ncbi:MAG: hypothetical protein ACREYE_10465 [Gammaproteobacteria bacterium]
MPQMLLPLFPDGVTHITPELAFIKRDGQITYFNGQMPVFVHDEADICTFRLITSQFCVNGNAKQVDIVRAFGVPSISVKRTVERYRKQGPRGFYVPRRTRGSAVLTPPVLAQAQHLLDEGFGVAQVAERLELKKIRCAKRYRPGGCLHGLKKSDRRGSVRDPTKRQKRALRAGLCGPSGHGRDEPVRARSG